MDIAVAIVLLVLVAFVIIVLVRSVRIVPQARAGVVERLGKYQRTL
ncbi:MAG TPA: SPFH/Band 7/PHB domain protein, partial [Arthrobacter sp.]